WAVGDRSVDLARRGGRCNRRVGVRDRSTQRNRKFADSSLEGDGFELPVPRAKYVRGKTSPLGRIRPNCRSTLLELKLGPVDIPELLQRVRAQRKAEARPVRGMHHAVRAYVEGLVEEIPHHRHVALRNLKDVAVRGYHRNVQ